jgi:hypothetical protein
MGWWSDLKDSVSDVADAVGDTVSDVAESVADTAVDAASSVATITDDYVFDTVDFATLGLVDVDYDGGTFGVSLGIDGVAGAGVSLGENGFGFESDTGLASASLQIGPDGVAASSSAGIDFGPLPYMEGHVEVSADGDVSVGGQIQGTIPTPIGILSGEAAAQVDVTDEGWGASIEADGTLRLPSGTTVGAGVAASHMETDDGSITSVSGHGSVSMPGIGTAAGGAGYQRVEQGGDVLETFHAEGQADVLGVRAAAEADYVHAQTADGQEYSDWSGQAAVDGPGDLDFAYSSETPATASDVTGGDITGGAAAVASTAPMIGAAPTMAAPTTAAPAEVPTDPVAAPADPIAPAPDVPDVAAVPVPEPELVIEAPAEPVDTFDTAIAAADQVEASVDDLFQGME